MVACELVVAIRRDDEARRRFDLACEETEDVQRALVRPVHVLDDDEWRSCRSESHQPFDDVVWRAPRVEETGDPGTRALGDLQERPQRPRRGQGIAPTPKEGRPRRQLAAESANERRLPDARLAADEDQPSMPGGGIGERCVELGERLLALEENVDGPGFDDRHHWILTRSD